ncbi:hypothetical protein OG985_05270 [Streptomyces sp. NBC_00289]|uniref:hypothetical protein n=1 Tax=Streptomyces sp. NBC_00289 TaxID=2975703 RepID=UPI00324626A1
MRPDVDTDSPPRAARFFSGMALMMACVAGGITGTALSAEASKRLHETAGPLGGPDWGDSADMDLGGFDGG